MSAETMIQTKSLYKFGTPYPEEQQWLYADVWSRERIVGGDARIVLAPARDQMAMVQRLVENMTGPFWLLYVLVVPRGGSKAGRFQSPQPLNASELAAFLVRFKEFLECDGRHNLWVASATTAERLIYDRHNVIYAYGDLAGWIGKLQEAGLSEAVSVRFPDPHSHHYHEDFDTEERCMMELWDWHYTPPAHLEEL